MTRTSAVPGRGEPPTARVACIGECMVELKEQPDGLLRRSYGGDTLNTAVYLARLGVPVDYVTALGDDTWSDEMLAFWRAEGIGTGLVPRLPGRLPGCTSSRRTASASAGSFTGATARRPATCSTTSTPRGWTRSNVLYLSGITLSLYPEPVRTASWTCSPGPARAAPAWSSTQLPAPRLAGPARGAAGLRGDVRHRGHRPRVRRGPGSRARPRLRDGVVWVTRGARRWCCAWAIPPRASGMTGSRSPCRPARWPASSTPPPPATASPPPTWPPASAGRRRKRRRARGTRSRAWSWAIPAP